MGLTPEQIVKLQAALDPQRIKHEQQGAREVSYLEGWDVINAANWVFGFDGWDYEVLSVGIVSSWPIVRTRNNQQQEVAISLYEAKVAVTAGGARRVDVGTNITSGDTPEAHEPSIKGAVTDGLKRALRTFGDQFGNGLYEKPAARQQREQASRSARPQTGGPPASSTPAGGQQGAAGDTASGPRPQTTVRTMTPSPEDAGVVGCPQHPDRTLKEWSARGNPGLPDGIHGWKCTARVGTGYCTTFVVDAGHPDNLARFPEFIAAMSGGGPPAGGEYYTDPDELPF